jgi:hypothetical protein
MECLATENFEDLIGKPALRDCDLNLDALHLPETDLGDLERAYSEEQLWGVIKGMSAGKAPGRMASRGFSRCVGPSSRCISWLPFII